MSAILSLADVLADLNSLPAPADPRLSSQAKGDDEAPAEVQQCRATLASLDRVTEANPTLEALSEAITDLKEDTLALQGALGSTL